MADGMTSNALKKNYATIGPILYISFNLTDVTPF